MAEVLRQETRPWGRFEVIADGTRFSVKRLIVSPGGVLSLQLHHHRSEHWVVVRGVAEIELDGDKRFLHEEQSCFIPTGKMHRLANPGKIDLEIVEVQTGSYLGEDDIVRYEDIYKREA